MTPRPGPSPDRPPPHPSETHRSVRRAVALWLDAGLECTSRQKTKFSPPSAAAAMGRSSSQSGPSSSVEAIAGSAGFTNLGRLSCRASDHMKLEGTAKYEPTAVLARKSSATACCIAISIGMRAGPRPRAKRRFGCKAVASSRCRFLHSLCRRRLWRWSCANWEVGPRPWFPPAQASTLSHPP